MVKQFDPLKYLPRSDAVRGRLSLILEEARRLRVLLRTAEEIEKGDASESAETQKGDDRAST